jgi:hypothetical protein
MGDTAAPPPHEIFQRLARDRRNRRNEPPQDRRKPLFHHGESPAVVVFSERTAAGPPQLESSPMQGCIFWKC